MSLNNTPRGNRLHIGIFGRRNAGKSSLINALTGQNLAIVSNTPGTTADPVYKSMELHPIGPVVFIDTAGFDDEGELGKLRVAKSADIIARTDIAVLVADGSAPDFTYEETWLARLEEAGVPVITVLNKIDKPACISSEVFIPSVRVSAKTGEGIEALRKAIQDAVPEEYRQDQLFGDYPVDGSLVLLVMPQDIQAPRGRLILPQVQTIRELLDRKCTVLSTTADGITKALDSLNRAPDLIVTDSQCFSEVYKQKPPHSALTSFSILMAASKGDLDTFVKGVHVLDDARTAETFHVLIAEACTHVPLNEDIGTVKIPGLLHDSFGDRVRIASVRGNDFPDAEGLKQFDLIIHCGACMFNRKHVMSRIAAAQEAGVPITNYGIFLAYMAGILDKVSLH